MSAVPGESGPAAARGESGAQRPETQTALTTRIRALYEDSTVPVREIAAIAGVTERTLYKYVARGKWKRRYRCLTPETAARRAHSGRRYVPRPGFEAVKGAGARFIRRADRNKPVARGLKALSPAEHAAALAEAGEAERAERLAVAEAQDELCYDTYAKALKGWQDSIAQLANYRDERERKKRFEARRYHMQYVAANVDNDPTDQGLRRGIDTAQRLLDLARGLWQDARDRLAAVRAAVGEID